MNAPLMRCFAFAWLALAAAAPAAEMPLSNPPAWGRVIGPATRGAIDVRQAARGALSIRIRLEGMLPHHPYILCLNDRPNHPGNEWLPSAVPGHAEEHYVDFARVVTDDRGRAKARVAVHLHPGFYNVRFYVKDPDDFKIVLFHDYFDVIVK